MSIPLAALEEIIDSSGVAPRIEALLPTGVRHRQLRVRTLLAGMLLSQAGQRPAHLTRVRDALTSLPEPDQVRLGVLEDWKTGPHLLTYRQTERTFGLVTGALAKDAPDGLPSQALAGICDDLLEASVPDQFKDASTALAVDWTDVETFSRPPSRGSSDCADPEASWGHRSGGGPGQDSELFFGYYASAGTMMREEHGPPAPELARRMTVCSCHHDPARALVPVLTAMPRAGIPLGDILADSGYAHRDAGAWAVPLRLAGAQLVQDLHPLDRGPRGTHHGAIIANGNLYCPATPRTLLELGPLARDATPGQASAHDQQSAELARYKLGRLTSDDADGYHRVACPAAAGKIRCPLHPASMTLTRDRPEILTPPEHPPACCAQQTITVPPHVAAKTRQKHDYPSREHRRSYARRTGAERTFSTAKDPASNNIARGWTRLMGLAPLMLWLACLLAVRNQRILTAWAARQDDNTRRAAAGLPPRTRRRRRKTLASLAATTAPPLPQRHQVPPATSSTAQITPTRHGEQNQLPRPAPTATTPVQEGPSPNTRATVQNVRPKREHRRRSKVKTFWSPVTESNRRPSPYHGVPIDFLARRFCERPDQRHCFGSVGPGSGRFAPDAISQIPPNPVTWVPQLM